MTPSSDRRRWLSALLVFVLLVSTAPVVGAVTVAEEEMPAEAEVGTQINGTVLLEDLYREPNLESWTLDGETALGNVTWTVTLLDQGGNQIRTQSFDGRTFTMPGVNLADDVAEVRVKVTGTTPSVESYQYEPRQTFGMMVLTQTREGGTSNVIGTWTVEHYTAASLEARQAIDRASTDIQVARQEGGNTGEAEDTLGDAVAAYESGSFELAVTLAEKAGGEAESAGQTAETTRFLLWGGLAVVVALVVGAVIYWYQHREMPYDRLG